MTPTHLPALLHSAFYRFTPLADPVAAAALLRRLAQGLTGSIVVAAEGISGTLAGPAALLESVETALQHDDVLDGALRGIAFKHSGCSTAPFGRLKVSVKPEIVASGLPADASTGLALPPDEHDASHLTPAAWQALLRAGEVVVLDNRNHFEFRLGHFRGATDPLVHNFRDFVAYVHAHAPAWRAAGRPVAMYCTGGIRCDKTAPWLRSLGLQVWQLQGGILNYLQHRPGDTDDQADDLWQGDCFVFDNRVALDATLQETNTTADQVFDATQPDEVWRLQRAQRLDGAAG